MDIADWRKKIDELDRKLVELLRIYERVMDVMRQIQKEEIAPQMAVEGATGDTELDNEVND